MSGNAAIFSFFIYLLVIAVYSRPHFIVPRQKHKLGDIRTSAFISVSWPRQRVQNISRSPKAAASHLESSQNLVVFNTPCEKLKCSRYRPGVAQRVGRGIALLFHDRGTRRGWVVRVTSRPLFTPGKDTVPILQEAGWTPGPVWMGGKSRHQRDSIPDPPTRSQSLYRLSYPVHNPKEKTSHYSSDLGVRAVSVLWKRYYSLSYRE